MPLISPLMPEPHPCSRDGNVTCINNLPRVALDRDLNLPPVDCKSSDVTTSHHSKDVNEEFHESTFP